MNKLKRILISPWVMRFVSSVGGVSVVQLASARWRVTAYLLYCACIFAAVVYGASMDQRGQGGGDE